MTTKPPVSLAPGDQIIVLREALKDTLNALAYTVTNVPGGGKRPHWCRLPGGKHDATCIGMLSIQHHARVALAHGDADG